MAAVAFEPYDVTTVGIPALRVGTNILAIHCLNGADFNSSDLLMVPKLTWLPAPIATGGGQVYAGPLTLNTSATVKARLLANGIWSPITTATFIVNAVPASAANLVISEIHYHPTAPTLAEIAAGFNSSSDFEFIELLNVSPNNVDLSNCRFTSGVTYDFGSNNPVALTLPPGGRILLVGNRAAFAMRNSGNPPVTIFGEFSGNLNNSGERIILLAANSNVISDFTYGTVEPWPVDADGQGYSLVLNNPAGGAAYSQAASWRSSAQAGGTPGAPNGVAFNGSPSGDTDNDGFKDFAEYALGSNWNDPGSMPQQAHSLAVNPPGVTPGTYLSYSFTRNLSADGFLVEPQNSTNLTTWGGAGIVYVGTTNQGNGTALVTYRSLQPVTAPPLHSFMRTRISSLP